MALGLRGHYGPPGALQHLLHIAMFSLVNKPENVAVQRRCVEGSTALARIQASCLGKVCSD